MKKTKQETWYGLWETRVALWAFVGHLGACHISSKLYWITIESALRQIWFVIETYDMLWVMGVRATFSGADILTHFV